MNNTAYDCTRQNGKTSFCYKKVVNAVVCTPANLYCGQASLTATCGNGIVEAKTSLIAFDYREACDDGNVFNGDGCSSSCEIEEFYYCTNINVLNRNICLEKCGDDYVDLSEECDDGNFYDGDGCTALSCTIEPLYKCDNQIPNLCTYLCGDGVRNMTAGEECDDNNSQELDGCSKDCKIESGYQCSQGPKGYDICSVLPATSRPSCWIEKHDSDLQQITVKCSVEMRTNKISSSDLELRFSGPNGPYRTKYKAYWISGSQFVIDYTVDPGVEGGVGESMNILFNNPKNFVSSSGGIVDVSDSSKFTVTFPYVKADKSTTGVAGSSSLVAFLTSLAISVGAGILTGGSLELMWCMINTLQIIYYIGLMSLLYPPHVNVFFGFLALANANNALLSRISVMVFGTRIEDVNPVTNRFEALGMSNDSFTGNASDKIPMIFLVLMYFCFIVICLII